MVTSIIIGLLAGAFATNGVPHFVKGISGQMHMTPFQQPSSARANVVWGWLNLVVGVSLWSTLSHADYDVAAIAAALGSLITATALASYWTKHPEKNQPPK